MSKNTKILCKNISNKLMWRFNGSYCLDVMSNSANINNSAILATLYLHLVMIHDLTKQS